MDARSADAPGPADLARILADIRVPWWLCGGWALELHLGRPVRPHADLDVGVWRDNFARLTGDLPQAAVRQVRAGVTTPLACGVDLPGDVHQAWVWPEGVAWAFEVLVQDRDGGTWTYRRDLRVRMPAEEIIVTASGYRVVRPEIQLLFKSKDVRPKDQIDFDVVAPTLDPAARAWLAEALRTTSPGHAWIARLL